MARDVEELRRRVLDASLALVVEQGVRGVSFREVARRAGVSHQTPYHHFGDHLGILRAIADEGFAGLDRAMQEAAGKTADPLDALVEAGLAYVGFARSNPGHFRVMFQGGLHDRRADAAHSPYRTLVRLCTAAHRAGHGRPLTVEALTHLAWSTVHGLALLEADGLVAGTGAALGERVVSGLAALLRGETGGRPSSGAGRPRRTGQARGGT